MRSLFHFACYVLTSALWLTVSARAELVKVRYPQGSQHGFVVLKSKAGVRLASGDVTQVVSGDRVTSRLVLRFLDGSMDDDTTVFSQRGVFRLISDHHIQHGPSFPRAIDVLVDAAEGQVTSRTRNGKMRRDKLDIPPDLANGLPPNLLMNILPTMAETEVSWLAPTEKPRLIHISIKPAGKAPFTVGDTKREALDFVLHPELGGVMGMLAPLIGKQPADYHIWILEGDSPAVIREEGQLYEGGPIWRIEQAAATFPDER